MHISYNTTADVFGSLCSIGMNTASLPIGLQCNTNVHDKTHSSIAQVLNCCSTEKEQDLRAATLSELH